MKAESSPLCGVDPSGIPFGARFVWAHIVSDVLRPLGEGDPRYVVRQYHTRLGRQRTIALTPAEIPGELLHTRVLKSEERNTLLSALSDVRYYVLRQTNADTVGAVLRVDVACTVDTTTATTDLPGRRLVSLIGVDLPQDVQRWALHGVAGWLCDCVVSGQDKPWADLLQRIGRELEDAPLHLDPYQIPLTALPLECHVAMWHVDLRPETSRPRHGY